MGFWVVIKFFNPTSNENGAQLRGRRRGGTEDR